MTGTAFGITWSSLEHLLWLPLLLLIFALLIARVIRTIHVCRMLAKTTYAKQFLIGCSRWRIIFKALLISIAASMIFFALLRPRFSKKDEIVEQKSRDLVIALDVSRSMLAADCSPNRLECAKKKIKELVKMLSSERVGLILFSGSALVQCPLTADHAAFLLFLDQIDAETISSGTTALDQAIERAHELFSMSGNRKNKLLVIFTDGEDFSSNLTQIKQTAISEGIHIFTFGVGTVEGAPIPLFDIRGNALGHQKDAKGNIVISHLNEGILKSLATESGSQYIHMTPDTHDLKELQQAVVEFETERFEDKKIALLEEQYHYFLLIAFVCLVVEWLL